MSELLRIDIAPELPFIHCDAHRLTERGQPVFLRRDEIVSNRSGLIVELAGGGDEDAASRQRSFTGPVEPVLKQCPYPCLAPWLPQRGPDDFGDKMRNRRAQH